MSTQIGCLVTVQYTLYAAALKCNEALGTKPKCAVKTELNCKYFVYRI